MLMFYVLCFFIKESLYLLSFFEIFTCPCLILFYFKLHTQKRTSYFSLYRSLWQCAEWRPGSEPSPSSAKVRVRAHIWAKLQKCAKNSIKIIVKLTVSYLLLQQANAMTGNDVSLLKLSLKDSWNRFKGTYFWRVLAIWNHCVAGLAHTFLWSLGQPVN